MEISGGHHQLMASHSLDEVFSSSNTRQPSHLLHHQITQNQIPDNQQQQNQQHQQPQSEPPKKPRPHPDQALKCPRCDSTNTKFCYYNNYSLSQPRYFCKGCRRYWTQGGSLRNVPVGGGCRKNKRASPSPSNSSPTPKKVQENPQSITSNNTNKPNSNLNPNPLLSPLLPAGPVSQHSGLTYDPRDLSLAFACNLAKPNIIPALHEGYGNPSGFLDILRGGGVLETNSNTPTNNEGVNSIGGTFQGFYYGYGASRNNANVVGPVGAGTGREMVLPAFDGSASISGAAGSSVESGDAGGTVSGSDNLVVQGCGSSGKAALDGVLHLQQLGGDGNDNVSGTGNGLVTGNGIVLESARDYWSQGRREGVDWGWCNHPQYLSQM